MGNTTKPIRAVSYPLQPHKLGVSRVTGFLPESQPLGKFTTAKFTFLDTIAAKWLSDVKSRIGKNELDSEIGKMEILDITQTNDIAEIRRIYSVLTMLSHLYVWQDGNNPKQVLPQCLAVPLVASAKKLGLSPVLTHAAVDLYNWKLINPNDGWHMNNLKCWHTMTGTDDEEWFYLIMTLIENHSAICIDQGLSLLDELSIESKAGPSLQKPNNQPSLQKITGYLNNMAAAIKLIKETTARMKEKCRPDVFFNVLRPFLSGWDSKTKFPKGGLGYNGVDDKVTILSYVGGSAGQSSAIQFIDSIFEVEHTGHALKFLNKMLEYMPLDHKTFLFQVRNKVKSCSLLRWLKSQTFTKVDKSTATAAQHKTDSNPSTDNKAYIGTGGTSFEVFLKECQRDTTDVLAVVNNMGTIDANVANCLEAYGQCIKELAGFRAAHYDLVHNYIIKQISPPT